MRIEAIAKKMAAREVSLMEVSKCLGIGVADADRIRRRGGELSIEQARKLAELLGCDGKALVGRLCGD